MPERLPLTLRAYRLLTAALAPLAPALISRRRKRDKEHVARTNERYGETTVARPPEPLVWVHAASVGELLAVIPLIERIREMAQRIDALVRHRGHDQRLADAVGIHHRQPPGEVLGDRIRRGAAAERLSPAGNRVAAVLVAVEDVHGSAGRGR